MRKFDCFPFAGSPTELLLLECRLTELYDVVDAFVIVEATVDHQDHRKPLNFDPERFAPWKDKIQYVVADEMPTRDDKDVNTGEQFTPRPDGTHVDNWCWAREHAQREYIAQGLAELEAGPDDIVLQSDADEIPRPLAVRNLRLRDGQTVTFSQKGHFWAIDWLYPYVWNGTVATKIGNLQTLSHGTGKPFSMMRDTRNSNTLKLPNAGWHFSWLGGAEAAKAKVGSFCHPEVVGQMNKYMGGDWGKYQREGQHIGGGEAGLPVPMHPVEVDGSYPKWMQDPANVPDSWRRPR